MIPEACKQRLDVFIFTDSFGGFVGAVGSQHTTGSSSLSTEQMF